MPKLQVKIDQLLETHNADAIKNGIKVLKEMKSGGGTEKARVKI